MSRILSATPRGAGAGRAGLEQRLLRRLRQLRLAPGAGIIVGFSGGADSLALAAALASVAAVGRITVHAVHVDHGLRASSASEQAAAAALAERLGVAFRGERVGSGALARHHGVGSEEAARRERYRALAGAADALGAAVVALAHHADDQAETVLLHLLRGAGLAGAAGMAELTERVVPWWNGDCFSPPRSMRLWRPFLSESRAVLRAYVVALGLDPIADPSNADSRFRRNAIRSEVLPMLERIQPGAVSGLARYAALAADDDALLDALAERALLSAIDARGRLDPVLLLAEPPALRRRMTRQWLARDAGGGCGAAKDRVEAVIRVAARAAGHRPIEIGDGWRVELAGGRLRCLPPDPGSPAHDDGNR